MTDYRRKLYAFLRSLQETHGGSVQPLYDQLPCLAPLDDLHRWWATAGHQCHDIGSSSDRINLAAATPSAGRAIHPISGQPQPLHPLELPAISVPEAVRSSAETAFWWFWRFYPEYLAQTNPQALLHPAHAILPDCPLHSHQSTVSALAGAMFPEAERRETPYLLLFSFSPVQEFIKASRKFLDFWAGSYLLHYLSARLCWQVAKEYGPDAIIVPSLWSQEIVDALMLQDADFAGFEATFRATDPAGAQRTLVERFTQRDSNSLSTAGFPNMITVLVPGKEAAEALGQHLTQQLTALWKGDETPLENGRTEKHPGIGEQVRDHLRQQVIEFLTDNRHQAARDKFWQEFKQTLPENTDTADYRRELELLKQASNWEWNHLWEAQLAHTWEPYWVAVPLGDPQEAPVLNTSADDRWIEAQDAIAWPPTPLPSEAEKAVFSQLNVGTWWGSLQQRLRTAHMAVKNTRHWRIPTAPGPRSSLSGQFSALHPRLNYQVLRRNGSPKDFRQGGGLPDSSMRLFWLLMAYAYKGLFNGSEMLNALELTKRMAWQFGGVAASLGIDVEQEKFSKRLVADDETGLGIRLETLEETEIDYEKLIRFPNLSSIAAARFMHNSSGSDSRLASYWRILRGEIRHKFTPEQRKTFGARTRGRPTQVAKTDRRINPNNRDGQDYNGVMFSSRWLADEMNLEKNLGRSEANEVSILRGAVEAAHKQAGFGEGSPSDWWVIVLGDGDGMGQYISGEKLHIYKQYIVEEQVDTAAIPPQAWTDLLATPKRMGPATHIGLNRALLDFSNRLVPYLTEQRYCGRVIYSGGDDVMAVLPLEDLPGYLGSLRAAWSGGTDPEDEFTGAGGYWHPNPTLTDIPPRPYFTMGEGATMSLGVVIANKAVPLPTVLESLWEAEATAKAMPGKDGLCFRVVYGGGNTLEAVMKGTLLAGWWQLVRNGGEELSPVLYRLAEELPRRALLTENSYLFAQAAQVLVNRRDEGRRGGDGAFEKFCQDLDGWLRAWEDWAWAAQLRAEDQAKALGDSDPEAKRTAQQTPGTRPEDLGYLLRFSAFWVSKDVQRRAWQQPVQPSATEVAR